MKEKIWSLFLVLSLILLFQGCNSIEKRLSYLDSMICSECNLLEEEIKELKTKCNELDNRINDIENKII